MSSIVGITKIGRVPNAFCTKSFGCTLKLILYFVSSKERPWPSSLSAPKDTRCKTHPWCINDNVPFWKCESTKVARAITSIFLWKTHWRHGHAQVRQSIVVPDNDDCDNEDSHMSKLSGWLISPSICRSSTFGLIGLHSLCVKCVHLIMLIPHRKSITQERLNQGCH